MLPGAYERVPAHAHNNFLNVLAETGIIGFTAFVSMLSYIVFRCGQTFYTNRNNLWAGGMLMATVALQINGLTEYNFENFAVMRVFWLMTGLTWKMMALHDSE